MTLAYFALTFVITWTLWALAPRLGAAAGIVFMLGTFTPSLVSLTLTHRLGGREAIRALTCQLVKWPRQLRWYAFAIFYMAAVKVIVAVLFRVYFGHWPAFGTEFVPFMFAAILISMWVQAGEELGWRGFALPRMTESLGLAPASVLLGAIWALWHLPLFYVQASDTFGQSFPTYFVQVVPMSVTMAWLYWRTRRSLIIVMMLHAAVNNTKDIVPSLVPGATDMWALSTSPVAWLTVTILWISAVGFLIDMRGVRKIPT